MSEPECESAVFQMGLHRRGEWSCMPNGKRHCHEEEHTKQPADCNKEEQRYSPFYLPYISLPIPFPCDIFSRFRSANAKIASSGSDTTKTSWKEEMEHKNSPLTLCLYCNRRGRGQKANAISTNNWANSSWTESWGKQTTHYKCSHKEKTRKITNHTKPKCTSSWRRSIQFLESYF